MVAIAYLPLTWVAIAVLLMAVAERAWRGRATP
jgi:hypothetical protein